MTDEQFKTLLKEMHAMRQSLYEVRQELAALKLSVDRPKPSRDQNRMDAMGAVEVDLHEDIRQILERD